MNRPAFRTDVKAEFCDLEVRVNDVPVNQSQGNLPTSEMAPVTPWMTKGSNTLSLQLKPLDPVASASVSLTVHEAGLPENGRQVLTTLSYIADSEIPTTKSSPPGPSAEGSMAGAVEFGIGQEGVYLSRTINTPEPLKRWRWLDSVSMTNTQELQDEVFDQYLQIWNLLASRNLAGLPSLLAERTQEYRQALYGGDADIPADYGLSQMVEVGTLYPLKRENLKFSIFGNGRLAEFRSWNDKPAISFTQGNLGRYFRFVFRRDGRNLVVTR